MRQVVAIIPARYASIRFPGKPLVCETGRPLVQHVYERAQQARLISRVIVATDDQRILDAVTSFGGEAVMTRTDHPNGSSRIAEVAANLDAEVVVNVQGDEPEIDPAHIDLAVDTLGDCDVATLASPFDAVEDPADPDIVKVVVDRHGRALYFSRSVIPFDRDATGLIPPLKHIGLYAFRRTFLLDYVNLPVGRLEEAEQLEQLRILETGGSITVAMVRAGSHGIDTPEQYRAFVRQWKVRHGGAGT